MYPYYIEYEGNELSLLDERAIKEAMGFEFEKVKPNQNAVGKLCLYPVTSENGWNRYYYCFNGKSDVKLHNGITDGTSKEQLLSILNNNFIAAQFNDDMFFFTAFINNEEIDYSKLKFFLIVSIILVSILETYEREIFKSSATSFWVCGGFPSNP